MPASEITGKTSTRKLPKWAPIGGLAAVFVLLAVAYILAGGTPACYRPAEFDGQQRQTAAKQFYRHLTDIDDAAQTGETFSVHITEGQLNRYLAAADEIAAMLPDGRPGQVRELTEAAELRGPAVAIDGGVVRLMARAGQGGRVVSIDLEAWVDGDGLLHAVLRGVRIGYLPVPRSLVRGQLAEVRHRLLDKLTAHDAEENAHGGLEADLASRAADYAGQMVLAALDGKVIAPQGRWRHRQLRLAGIEAVGGELVLYVAPVARPAAKAQPPPPPTSSQVSVQSSPSARPR